jgi:hypothetical protein
MRRVQEVSASSWRAPGRCDDVFLDRMVARDVVLIAPVKCLDVLNRRYVSVLAQIAGLMGEHEIPEFVVLNVDAGNEMVNVNHRIKGFTAVEARAVLVSPR